MTDYIYVIWHAPLYTYQLLVAVIGFTVALPWPSWQEFFGSMAIFVGLYPLRALMKAILPEEKITRRVYRRRQAVPSAVEHRAGIAAAASSIISHH